ncbi:MAG: hypothetical protein LC623_09795, partial [Halobacteriales archaeon]|nr:hypothetical protein [Halobacteriales archaeon]
AGLSPPANLNIRMPFYGDELMRLLKELDAPLLADVTTKGAPIESHEAVFRGELLYDLAMGAGLTDADIMAHYAGQLTQKGPLNWEWVQAILRALDSTPMGSKTLDIFTRDVYAYLSNQAVRRAVNAIVADSLQGRDCLVVAHSLGTVVTYNVLREAGAAARAKRYITVGSPLGVKAIQRFIIPPALAMPPGLREWFNAYDERDVVALRPLDDKTFPITPTIKNRNEVRNGTDNRHGISGYLQDPIVAGWIHESLTNR